MKSTFFQETMAWLNTHPDHTMDSMVVVVAAGAAAGSVPPPEPPSWMAVQVVPLPFRARREEAAGA